MAKFKVTAEPGVQEIIISSTIDAPRERVFKAYTDPDAIPDWWGPSGIMTIVDKMDVQPGGEWRFVQRDEAGVEFAFHGVFHDITSPRSLVQTFEFEGTPGHVLLETVTFEEQPDDTTQITSVSVFQSVEDRDGMLQSGMEGGAEESMQRLEENLAKGSN